MTSKLRKGGIGPKEGWLCGFYILRTVLNVQHSENCANVIYGSSQTARSLTVYLDGELRLDLAPDVARLAAVDALVLVAPQVGDHQRRLHPVAVLVVRRQQDVVVLSIKHHLLVANWIGLHQITFGDIGNE